MPVSLQTIHVNPAQAKKKETRLPLRTRVQKRKRELREASESSASEPERSERHEKPQRPSNPLSSEQKTLTCFVKIKSISLAWQAPPAQHEPQYHLFSTLVTTIQVYKYNHKERSSFRHTLVSLREKHTDVHALQVDLRKEYGLSSEALRCQIGDFNIEDNTALLRERTIQSHRPVFN